MITIIGAGIGGLTLAAILKSNGMDCAIHDADLSASSRHQGGMLNINEGPAHDALVATGAYQAFKSKVLIGADAMKMVSKDGETLLDMKGDGSRPEIDRGSLRTLLAQRLPEGTIRWGSRVTKIERGTKSFQLTFADGRSESAKILIGADGAWSRVRPLLTKVAPNYTGISFVEYRFQDTRRKWPEVAKLVGDGLMFALAEDRGVIAHREPDDEICIYAAARVPQDHFPANPSHEFVLALFDGWSKSIRTLLAASDGPLIQRPIFALPTGLTWDRVPGVTLLGDAAHVMSPFAGEGVNLAITDAGDLAKCILTNRNDLEAAFAAYEALLFPRAKDVAEQSAANLEMAFSPDSPKPFFDFFSSIRQAQQS